MVLPTIYEIKGLEGKTFPGEEEVIEDIQKVLDPVFIHPSIVKLARDNRKFAKTDRGMLMYSIDSPRVVAREFGIGRVDYENGEGYGVKVEANYGSGYFGAVKENFFKG
tara:strand:- start:246 stop:572 length:327 start_codon:yes stop_codon:yes gene_type:complete